MALFGGKKTTTSSFSRPEYVMGLERNVESDYNNLQDQQYQNRQYASMTPEQQALLSQYGQGTDYTRVAGALSGAGQQGLGNLDYAQQQLQNLYANGISTDDIEKMSRQLYNNTAVENAIAAKNQASEQQYATETNPAIAQQANAFGGQGFGSGQNLTRRRAEQSLVGEEQANASNLTSQAQQAAEQQATSVLTGNRANQIGALQGMISTGQQQANMFNQSNNLYNQQLQNQMAGANMGYQDVQNANENDYMNQLNAQNMDWTNINNRLNAVGSMNSVRGQKITTTSSGGGSMFGMLAQTAMGAAQGFMMGGPAGAAVGAGAGAAGYIAGNS